MLAVRRSPVSARARRALAAVAASALLSPCGVGTLPGDAPDGGRSPAGPPIATETAVPGCPQPRCWWLPALGRASDPFAGAAGPATPPPQSSVTALQAVR